MRDEMKKQMTDIRQGSHKGKYITVERARHIGKEEPKRKT
jgi:hypothetical protein